MQGIGQFAAAIMALIVVTAYKGTLEPVQRVSECSGECLRAVDVMWRVIIGFGSIPGWFALYYRLTIPETPRYTFDVLYDVEKASADARRYRSGKKGGAQIDRLHQARAQQEMLKYRTPRPGPVEAWCFFSQKSNALKLLGTAGSWFLLDVAFYGINLNSSSVLRAIGFDKKDNIYMLLHNAAVGQLVLICAGSIPGYWFTVAFVDIIGRRPIQLMGFTILTVLLCVIGFNFSGLSEKSLLVLYILCQFFFNFGTRNPFPSPFPPHPQTNTPRP
jgi:PHS family inorganic phosphate transporter-like MFS transporter